MILEGPSGIGKTTTVVKAADETGDGDEITILSARKPSDVVSINTILDEEGFGTIIIDDFHRLPEKTKNQLADKMKIMADMGDEDAKLVLIGINKAGQQLVTYARDVASRIDTFKLESNPSEKITELVELGEKALNISIAAKDPIANAAQGSFQIAQLLCHRACTLSKITSTVEGKARALDLSYDVISESVMESLAREFDEVAKTFARGPRLRKEGRAPYLRLLRWLSESDEWALDIKDKIKMTPEHGESVGQVISKGYLEAFLNGDHAEILQPHFNYDAEGGILSVEDPRLVFYLKNINWRAFIRRCGYTVDYFPWKYDFALSFAGQDRGVAEALASKLKENEIAVFYDFDHVDRILAQNIEEYLAPIYRSEARFVIPILSADYPTRIWTKFESDQFRERFGENSIIPITFTSIPGNYFAADQEIGGLAFDPEKELESEVQRLAKALKAKLLRDREEQTLENVE
ncbi:TIR domain-containing protein [Sphingomicrobium flavum]|uniref:TIR domain-containing protein n=1 Tax=Sphingomicrobium flavum TaxID=1229164 RepID=UPI0021AD6CFB|nr:TIR domain-containing protein [Sphingomicrobium flavum]